MTKRSRSSFNKLLMATLMLFFVGKPAMELCAHVFDLDVDMELCEIEEEDSTEKEIDDLEDKLLSEFIDEMSAMENHKLEIYDRTITGHSEFNPGVITPPPEHTFNV